MKKKPQLLETYRPRATLPISVDLFLDKDQLDFFFTFQGETHRKGDIHDLRAKAREVIEASVLLTFIPVIDVLLLEKDFGGKSVLGLNLNRFYAAKRPDGRWLTVSYEWAHDRLNNFEELLHFAKHDHHVSDRLVGYDLTQTVASNKNGSRSFLIPYQDDLWEGLIALQKAIETLRGRIIDLLASEEGHSLIRNSVNLLLGEGTHEED